MNHGSHQTRPLIQRVPAAPQPFGSILELNLLGTSCSFSVEESVLSPSALSLTTAIHSVGGRGSLHCYISCHSLYHLLCYASILLREELLQKQLQIQWVHGSEFRIFLHHTILDQIQHKRLIKSYDIHMEHIVLQTRGRIRDTVYTIQNIRTIQTQARYILMEKHSSGFSVLFVGSLG